MSALRRAGWEVEAVEWDPIAARMAREFSRCQVWLGDFRTVDLPRETYDLVVLNHVFEHLDEPVEAVQRIRALLKPNGRAVLVYPNPDALGAKIFGRLWFAWEVPRHLVLVTRDAMAGVSKRGGLSVEHVRTNGSQAALLLAFSRAYQAGRPVNDSAPDICYLDRAAALLERILVALGFKTGEELIVVLRQTSPLQESHDAQ
jgi:SAM-dependent methyltransferase